MAARKEMAKVLAEQKARKDASEKGTQDKYLEDEAVKEKKETAVKEMGRQSKMRFFTNKARKEAADSFRKEANKTDEKRLLEALKKLRKDEEKEEKPATPPTPPKTP